MRTFARFSGRKLLNHICQSENHEVVFRHPLKGAEGVPSRLGLSTRIWLRDMETYEKQLQQSVYLYPRQCRPPARGGVREGDVSFIKNLLLEDVLRLIVFIYVFPPLQIPYTLLLVIRRPPSPPGGCRSLLRNNLSGGCIYFI